MRESYSSRTMANTTGAVVHWAARYDLLIALLTLGRERRFREKLLRLARVRPGESVLDIGCGTGTLAIAARRIVGASAIVHGIDASPEMIERARHKAAKARADAVFEVALAQSLPFPDAQFDVVLSTVMLHHLPRSARPEAVREARRVLKPGGRLLAVDFGGGTRKGLLGHIHGHGGVGARNLVALATEAGLSVIDSGAAGTWDLQFALASRS
jgi:ubiquinone/menaquinone biosynthesis C-methylase UbiE